MVEGRVRPGRAMVDREPDKVADYDRNERMQGLRVIIAEAGLSAALPGSFRPTPTCR